jgi:transcriptional regulator with PAS, ATPase and Fis domain
MVVAAANAIEIQLAMKKAWQECETSYQHKNIIVNSIYEGLLVTNSDRAITLTNRRAQEILHIMEEDLLGVHINKLFSESFISYLEKRNGRIIDVQDEILMHGNRINCTVTCQPILTNGVFNGLVIVINEIVRAKKLVNKLFTRDAQWTFPDIIGKNPMFCSAVNNTKKIASTESNVLLLGESGTGKDIFAQAIHNASARRNGPFVPINCGALPKELIGSELFGYSEGAFTGARKGGKIGKFELADGGTLFLDEIGEMPVEQQQIFLRVLEDRKIVRIGGQEMIPVDVRIIAATNNNLENKIMNGTFRQDLFYRLYVAVIKIIPLRERLDDIKLLTEAFLEKFCAKTKRPPVEVNQDVWEYFNSYDWPGNIRELNNALERALILSDGKTLSRELFDFHCPFEKKSGNSDSGIAFQMINPIKSTLKGYEANMLKDLLRQNNWNISKASIKLGVSRTTLYRKIGVYGIKIHEE